MNGECLHTWANTAAYICPKCGHVSVFGSTSTPTAYHFHDGVMWEQQPNDAARKVLANLERWHEAQAASRKRAEEALKDWPA